LKQQSKKKIKNGTSGPNPEHGSFVAGLKGIMSPVADADFIETEHFLFAIVGETDSRITAFAIEQGEKGKNLKTYTQSLKLDGGQKIASITFSTPKGGSESRDSKQFIVAVACWEQCRVQVYQLNFKLVTDRGGFSNGQLTFSGLQNVMSNVHKIPPNKIRLSRQYPKLLVTCGDEKDTEYRLWNIT